MIKHFDCIVIGGGVIGGSIAYYLARKQKKVLLLERNQINSGSSQAAAGMLGVLSETSSINSLYRLGVQSRAMFPKLAEELQQLSGIDIQYRRNGLMKVATSQEQSEQYKKIVELQRSIGEAAQWLTSHEAQSVEQALCDHNYGAMYFPNEGQVLATSLNAAFVKAAQNLGAVISEHTDVQTFIIHHGQIQGVHTTNGEAIYADKVVMAAGAWSKSLLEQAGLSIDLYPVKGECFSVIDHSHQLHTTIFSDGCYLVPKLGGRIIVGATMVKGQFNNAVTVAGIRQLFESAIKLVPSIEHMSFERAWAGLRPQTPDGMPIIGAAPSCSGLYVALGHYRNGILLSPATGKGLVDLMEQDDKEAGRAASSQGSQAEDAIRAYKAAHTEHDELQAAVAEAATVATQAAIAEAATVPTQAAIVLTQAARSKEALQCAPSKQINVNDVKLTLHNNHDAMDDIAAALANAQSIDLKPFSPQRFEWKVH